MTAPDEFLAPIRERLAAATPGPWEAQEYVDIDEDGSYELANVVAPDPDAPDVSVLGVAPGILRNDAEFIAHSPETQARLLAALDGVLALHKPVTQRQWGPHRKMCRHDTFDWPCPTVAAITTTLEGQA